MFSLSVRRRFGRAVAVILAASLFSALPAAYDVTARRTKDFQHVESVVLYPLKCPRGIDCRILESRLAEDLADVGGYRVFSPAELRQLAFDRALDLSLPGAFAALIRSLGVDAVVLGGVPGVKSEDRWTFDTLVGDKSIKPSATTPDDAATITCFAPDGRTLFEGTAEGSSRHGLQVQQEIVARKFRSILKKALE